MMKIKTLPSKIKGMLKNLYNSIKTFNLNQKLQGEMENLLHQKDRQDKELKKLRRQYSIYKTKNKGLTTLEKEFFTKESTAKDNVTSALKNEIERLMKVIEKQQELIEQTPFLHNKFPQIKNQKI